MVIPGEIAPERLERLLDERRIDLVACAGYLKYLRIPAKYAG